MLCNCSQFDQSQTALHTKLRNTYHGLFGHQPIRYQRAGVRNKRRSRHFEHLGSSHTPRDEPVTRGTRIREMFVSKRRMVAPVARVRPSRHLYKGRDRFFSAYQDS